jgi:site-specific DNA recombinase
VKAKLIRARSRLEKELSSAVIKIENVKKLKSKALSKYLEDAITKADYNDYIANQDAELAKLFQEKERIEASMSAALDSKKLDEVKALVASALAFEEIDREVINRFIEKIVVAKDRTVKLYYHFAGTSKILELLG